jgi:hypothetical protein
MEAIGLVVEPVLYSDAIADDLAARLASFGGVLVWVDPISGNDDRTILDELLREVAARGAWVSAHPETIQKMGTKEVLYTTRELGWGADTRLYGTVEDLRSRLPTSLALGARVLKQNRGNGGIGVWKVDLVRGENRVVRVQQAAPRDDATEDLPFDEFVDRCAGYFAAGGKVVDQPFAERLRDGMIRAYLVEREVVGFARQQPADRSADAHAPAPDRVLGMPSAKTMYDTDASEFRALRVLLEREWVPALCDLVGLRDDELPVLWDADFLYGPRSASGIDTYMLCEINVSSVIPFPPAAPPKIAAAVQRRVRLTRG